MCIISMESIDEVSASKSKDANLKQTSSKQSINVADIAAGSKTIKNVSQDYTPNSKRKASVRFNSAPRGSVMQRTDRKQSVVCRASMGRRQSYRENTAATGRPKVGLIDFERLKADVYRDWVGRRDAFDLGQFKDKSEKKPKQKSPKKTEDEKVEEENEMESVQLKGVIRDTQGLEASLKQVQDVKRRTDALTPLVRKSSATGTKPLRTPSSTALRVGSSKAIETPPEETAQIQEVGADDMRKLNAISRRAKRKARSKGKAEKSVKKTSEPSAKASSSHGLTDQQVRAFREVFDLFDSNGGGTIDADELDLTLRSVNICLSKDEITAVLETIDKDGNGEIDFGEFLHLMTSTERFLETLTAERQELMAQRMSRREVLLFDALTEFMKKSAINSMDEIVGYYSTKYKKSHIPHVVNHYAAGARLIGLTEKQLKEHLENLTKANAASGENVSPYARPVHVVMSTANLPTVTNGNKKNGRIRLKIRLGAGSHGQVNVDISGGSGRSSDKPILMSGIQTEGRGWKSKRTEHIHVELPPHQLTELVPFDELTQEDLPYIRRKVTYATEMYRFARKREQVRVSLRHWKGLDAHLITPSILRHHYRRVFSTYTSIDTQYLPLPEMIRL